MKILFLQLSDIHISVRADGYAANVEKMVQALNTLGQIDECVIVLSGDITHGGKTNEYKVAGGMLGNLQNELKTKKFLGKWIHVVTVPGNHDLDLSNNNRTFDEIIAALKNHSEKILIDNDINSLKNYYKFAAYNGCFIDDKVISHRNLKIGDININFVLVNTAIFSLDGGNNQDMGIHYLSSKDVDNLIPTKEGDLNIIVMHHSTEWFTNAVKERMRDVLCDNFSIVFEGHEHDGYGENRKTNNKNPIIYMQGNSLSGDKNHQKGFSTIVYDTKDRHIKGTSFIWNNDYYKPTEVLNEHLQERNGHQYVNIEEFTKYLKYDDSNKLINQYFVFPSLSYYVTNKDDEVETIIIDDCRKLIENIFDNDRTIITGDSKAGKSTLAKILYRSFLDSETGIIPILLLSEDLRYKKVERIIEYAFKEQYNLKNNSYDKFLQLERDKKILIIDDAGRVEKSALNKILEYYDFIFSKIILFSEEKVDLNIGKRVVDALTEKKVVEINIKPFLYDKRKELITKVYNLAQLPIEAEKKKQEIHELNDIISSQVRYFKLDPEFIINFVTQYIEKCKFNFNPSNNVFNIVYETSIKNKIICNAHQADVNGIFNVMEEIAYYMHFRKKAWITFEELSKIIDFYNNEFRQFIKVTTVIEVGEASKIFIERNSKIRFKDSNLLSYFVAQALNKKYHFENIEDKIEMLLNNLCFGINSDIVLFMAMITSNPKIVGLVFDCANKHFENIEELSFDKKNIPFLCQSDFNVKDRIPDEKEKKEKEKRLVKYEEELKTSEFIELVDEYDYDENDMETVENQVMKSIKYIEILSKILPAFCHNLKAYQQDELVKALYSYPNRFIFQVLNEISENYEEFIEEIYNRISDIRKERNIAELSMESVKKMVEQTATSIVVNLYQLVASTATTKLTITALDAFNFKGNSNYSIMNLMMTEKMENIKNFSDKALRIYEESEIKLVKSMVKFVVRNYFLDHEVKIVGEGQALLDKFFGSSDKYNTDKKKVKIEMAKNRLRYN